MPIVFLFLQAERSDLSSRPNLYKVLYSFEAHRNKWRKAAAYMYRYFVRLNREGNAGGSHQLPHVLQERLHAYLLLSTHCSLLIPHLHGSTLFVKLMIKFLQVKDLGIFWWRTVCFVRLLIAVWFVSLHSNMLGLTFVLYSSGFWHRFWAF